MKIPKRIKYGYKNLNVSFIHSSDNQGSSASYNSWTDKIKISIDADKAKCHYTSDLIHELVEAINRRRELNLPHWQIQALAEDITDILVLNKFMETLEP